MCSNKVWTIPNILSTVRICLIPLIVYLYLFTNLNWLAGILALLSGITDIVDGYIARKFNQVSNVGKILDPIADKLTLICVLVCVTIKYNVVIILLVAEIIKDVAVAISSLYRACKNSKVHCADWEGKVCTCVCYLVILSLVFFNVSLKTSSILILVSSTIIILLGIKYAIKNFISISDEK